MMHSCFLALQHSVTLLMNRNHVNMTIVNVWNMPKWPIPWKPICYGHIW